MAQKISLSCSNFRRTKFGNGQFAVLVLCLTVADILTVFCGLLGKYSIQFAVLVLCLTVADILTVFCGLLGEYQYKTKILLNVYP
jgi:hypothetical protein